MCCLSKLQKIIHRSNQKNHADALKPCKQQGCAADRNCHITSSQSQSLFARQSRVDEELHAVKKPQDNRGTLLHRGPCMTRHTSSGTTATSGHTAQRAVCVLMGWSLIFSGGDNNAGSLSKYYPLSINGRGPDVQNYVLQVKSLRSDAVPEVD